MSSKILQLLTGEEQQKREKYDLCIFDKKKSEEGFPSALEKKGSFNQVKY